MTTRPLSIVEQSFAGLDDQHAGAMFGLIGAAVEAAANPADSGATALNEQCLRAIEGVLAEARLKYVGRQTQDPASFALTLNMTYTVQPGWAKQLKLVTRWRLVTPNGEMAADLETIELSQATETLPDKLDPKYQQVWIELAKSSAKQFVALATGEPSQRR
jgi:hypothetical protein